MELLNVRLVVKIPEYADNSLIPREILSQLLTKVAPEIGRQMGHSVAYIDQIELASVSPDASGRNSDKPKPGTLRKSALIALGAVLGVVFLAGIVMIAWYRRKKKRYGKIGGETCVYGGLVGEDIVS